METEEIITTQEQQEKRGIVLFFEFLSKQFRFSLIFLLLFAVLFLAIFPSLNKSISETHWSIIQQLVGGLEVMLGFGIKYYFDVRKEEQQEENCK